MNSNSVDLIYLDPPFNSNRDYWAPIGSPAEGAGFRDVFGLNDIKIAWIDQLRVHNPKLFRAVTASPRKSDMAYLIYMAPRLLEMRRILKETGSIFLHCDPTMSHWLKVVMDVIFEKRSCFRNEIIWCYHGPGSPAMRQFNRKHDTIFWYSKGERWTFNREAMRVPYKKKKQPLAKRFSRTGKQPDEEEVLKNNQRGKVLEDWWEGIPIVVRIHEENLKYPTQKPEALLKRIIEAASNEGDMVLDPFCGCATTLVVADRLNREWAGIDISPLAIELVKERIKKDQGFWPDVTDRSDPPTRTDLGRVPPYNSKNNKETLYGKQGGFCNGCRTHFETRHLTIDHIIARSDGGGDEIGNLQLLCHHCNATKGARGMEYLKKALLDKEILTRLVPQDLLASFQKD